MKVLSAALQVSDFSPGEASPFQVFHASPGSTEPSSHWTRIRIPFFFRVSASPPGLAKPHQALHASSSALLIRNLTIIIVLFVIRFNYLVSLFRVFRSLSAVFRTRLASLCNTCRIECTTDDVVSCTRQVLNSSSTDHDNAMLLQIVSLTWDVACHFDSVGKTNSGDLSQS